ncbi:hypothetical protein VIBNIPon4_110020 [Vibrio nigripulchritudo POn4]|uniref:AAA family ATPase n=1 Tax=Vibrio nigripulchritudo TaxID=28173 RepID=UPI0003B1D48D|nr:AAA family ATPase [Vibrio nigripulchritudo]CCN38434.1 hypothetical protein VIBNIAM115_910006 [Vibrio nigripulchritudo AM115]CCN43350.1 hypothetical protein VIBNIFTn2_500002 [Vibrio nigripulchritudo FTn2]CCN63101.1 hypothetical protein VIBNIPon4_110020 [Vibrio nigripulchritudo POn4]
MEIIYFYAEKYNNLSGGYDLSSSYTVKETPRGFVVQDREVDNFDFYHSEGKIKISVIIGENGSGKSNLLKGVLYNLCDSFYKGHNSRDLIIFEVDGELFYISSRFQSIIYKRKKVRRSNINFFTMYFNYMMDHFGGRDKFWSDQIFNRADSYKTPILVEPLKKNGVIDVSRLEYLNKQRIILHKEYDEDSILNEIFDPKAAKVSINLDKIKKIFSSKKTGNYLNLVLKRYSLELQRVMSLIVDFEKNYEKNAGPTLTSHRFDDFLPKVSARKITTTDWINRRNKVISNIKDGFAKPQSFTRYKYNEKLPIENEILRLDLRLINIIYIANKVDRLNAIGDVEATFNIVTRETFDVKVGIIDKTHRTEKLRNAVEFQDHLNYSILHDKLFEKTLYKSKSFRIDSLFLKYIPSWFDVELHDGRGVEYSALSSGEKSFYNLLTTIKYHLRNLSGYNEGKNNIVLLLDEVDIGLHPIWQRDFIKNIISFLNSKFVKSFNFHIIITSHSPFLLSDVNSQSTLLMKKGNKANLSDHNQTFGQNIHSLLSDKFFISDGLLTGSFAQEKLESSFKVMNKFVNSKSKNIKRTIAFKDYRNNRDAYIKMKDLIGDDYLRLAFNNIFDDSELKYKKIMNDNELRFDLEVIKKKIQNNPELYNKIIDGDI